MDPNSNPPPDVPLKFVKGQEVYVSEADELLDKPLFHNVADHDWPDDELKLAVEKRLKRWVQQPDAADAEGRTVGVSEQKKGGLLAFYKPEELSLTIGEAAGKLADNLTTVAHSVEDAADTLREIFDLKSA